MLISRRKYIQYGTGTLMLNALGACSDGGSSSGGGGGGGGAGEVKPLGLAIPDPLEVSNRLKAYIDWGTAPLPRSADNSDACPPIGDQGTLGSCTAWAVGYGLGSFVAAKAGGYAITSASHLASPGDMYAKLLSTLSFQCGNGTIIRTALDILCSKGLASLAENSYSDKFCNTPSSATKFRIKSWLALEATDRIGIRRQLASGNVLAFGSNVTDDIFSLGQSIYRATGKSLGGHALLLVGYDDNRSAYKVQNSWGTGWGSAGYFWFDYNAFERVTFEACCAVLVNAQPKPKSNLPPLVTSARGSAISDTYYTKEFLYVFVEFSNLWTMTGYVIKLNGVVVEQKSGFSQMMDATQLVINRPSNGSNSYPPGYYEITMTGTDVNNQAVSLKTTTFIMAFVADNRSKT